MKNLPQIFALFLMLSFASCKAIQRSNESLTDDDGKFSSAALEGFWLLSKVKFERDGRTVEEVRTRSNTVVIGVANGHGNIFEVSSARFSCKVDQPIEVRKNIFFEFAASGVCHNKHWIARDINSETLSIRDLSWDEINTPEVVDLEFTKATPTQVALVMYRVVQTADMKGQVFSGLVKFKPVPSQLDQ